MLRGDVLVTNKYFALVFAAILSLPALAEGPLFSGMAGDEKVGILAYTVQDIGEPAVIPYRLSVTLRCPGKSAKGGEILKNEAICQFRAPEFDKTKKVLTIRYSTSQTQEGEGKCDADWVQDFDLKVLCK